MGKFLYRLDLLDQLQNFLDVLPLNDLLPQLHRFLEEFGLHFISRRSAGLYLFQMQSHAFFQVLKVSNDLEVLLELAVDLREQIDFDHVQTLTKLIH